jgi:hypothetical protein
MAFCKPCMLVVRAQEYLPSPDMRLKASPKEGRQTIWNPERCIRHFLKAEVQNFKNLDLCFLLSLKSSASFSWDDLACVLTTSLTTSAINFGQVG